MRQKHLRETPSQKRAAVSAAPDTTSASGWESKPWCERPRRRKRRPALTGSFTPRLACQEPTSICHSSRAARGSANGRSPSRKPGRWRRSVLAAQRSRRWLRTRVLGSRLPSQTGRGHHGHQPDAVLSTVNARRVRSRRLRPRVPRGLPGIDGASAPRRPSVYVMAGTNPTGGNSQDGAARRRRQDRRRRPPGPKRSDGSCTPSSPAPDSNTAGRSLESDPLHRFSCRGIDSDGGVPMLGR